MKMMKSLILGTAVAFAASAGAQAADLPVKAKPVSYVKICPQYGPGFYYIPGTDICLQVGGTVFAEAGYHSAGAITTTATTSVAGESELNWRSRGYLSLDARQNTAYGTLRGYVLGGFQQRNLTSSAGYNTAALLPAPGTTGLVNSLAYGVQADGFVQYAYIQWAGITAGLANSFFDFGSNYLTTSVSSNPWTWTNLFAYTANLGNGLSATISLEDASTTRLGNSATTTSVVGLIVSPNSTVATTGLPVAHYLSPDIVANVRLDQAWGSAQIMGAAHQVRYSAAFGNDWGWAFGAGIEIKLPMLGAGDTIKFVAVTSEGAAAYTGLDNSPNGAITGASYGFLTGQQISVVTDFDATLTNPTDAHSYMVQFRHFWSPTVRSSFHAGYNEAYNVGYGMSLQVLQIGHSLAWSPVSNLTFSLDVLWSEIDTQNTTDDRLATWFRVTRTF